MRASSELPWLPVEAVVLDTKDTESGEVIAKLDNRDDTPQQ